MFLLSYWVSVLLAGLGPGSVLRQNEANSLFTLCNVKLTSSISGVSRDRNRSRSRPVDNSG